MNRRGLVRLLASVCALPLLSGCWNQRPIEQRAIVIAVGVTAHHQWRFLFPNVAVTADSLTAIPSAQQFYTVSVRAPTWQRAVHRLQAGMARKVSVGELQLLMVDDRLSTGQVTRIVDGLNTTGAVPATFWIAASPGSPAALLEQTSPQNVVPYYAVATYFDCRGCHPLRLVERGWQWWAQNATPGDSPYLPLARPTPHGVAVRQLLVYPLHGRPVLMPPPITQGFAYLTNRAVDVAVPVSLDDQAYTVARLDAQVRTRVHLTPRAVAVQVQVRAAGIIDDAPPHTLVTRSLEHAVGLAAAHVIAVRCRDTIDWANRTHTDPFGYAKRAAWLDDALGEMFSAARLTTLPIQAHIAVRVTIHGDGVAR